MPQNSVCLGEGSKCTWKEGVFCCWVGHSVGVDKVKLLAVLRSSISLLIFYLLVLLITRRGVLKSITIVMDLFLSLWSSVSLYGSIY